MHGPSQLISAHTLSNGKQPFEDHATLVAAPVSIKSATTLMLPWVAFEYGHSRCAPSTSVLRCITGEDEVTRFDSLVAGKAGVEHGFVGGFAVLIKLREPPAARCGVLF
jgi:hypothetical protein